MHVLFQMVKGALIGVCSILPGVSGGVLAVIFGVYKPLMSFFAHPITRMKKSIPLLLPVLIGCLAGVMLISKAIGVLLTRWETPVLCVFAGLMVKSVPSLYRDAGHKGRPRHAWMYVTAAGILASAWLFLFSQNGSYLPSFTAWWWALCGALWGLGIIIPGISPSSIFLLLNTYQQMSEGIGNLDFSILLPMAAGLIFTVALLSRCMNYLLTRWYSQVAHAILGIVFIFTLAIIISIFSVEIQNAFIYALCFGAGYAAAHGMEKLSAVMDTAGTA